MSITSFVFFTESVLILDAKVILRGKDSLTLSWKERDLASNIQNITISATWMSEHGISEDKNSSKRSPEFSSAGTIGLLRGIEPGDAGTVCLKTLVLDSVGQSTHILTYIRDILFGAFLIFLSIFSKRHALNYYQYYKCKQCLNILNHTYEIRLARIKYRVQRLWCRNKCLWCRNIYLTTYPIRQGSLLLWMFYS